jgi:LmbE family N-acetylglucosaminyl deacetylase
MAWLYPLLMLLGSIWRSDLRPVVRASPVSYLSNSQYDLIIVAHEDDWQLFMGDAIAERSNARDSLIFVYLTAGDDGRDSLYWKTRERAAVASARALDADTRSEAVGARCVASLVRAHSIRKCTVGKTISYFLRLPDGGRDGRGFGRYGSQSLRKLRRDPAGSIAAIDGSTSYRGWTDLAATVGELAPSSEEGRTTIVHTTDPSIRINPHDHFDHRMAGLLVEKLRVSRGWSVLYYVGYALGTRSANRSGDQVRDKTALFRVYDAEMIRADPRWSAYREHPGFYSQCMSRTYVRRATGARHR